MYCKYLSKALNGKIKCRKYKTYIILLETCKTCSERNVVANKPINKTSKKRIFVTKKTYEKVFERDKGKCRLLDCNCEGELELHHIRYRSEAKDLINEPSNCIMLCTFHHRLVHSNKKKWQPVLQKIVTQM